MSCLSDRRHPTIGAAEFGMDYAIFQQYLVVARPDSGVIVRQSVIDPQGTAGRPAGYRQDAKRDEKESYQPAAWVCDRLQHTWPLSSDWKLWKAQIDSQSRGIIIQDKHGAVLFGYSFDQS